MIKIVIELSHTTHIVNVCFHEQRSLFCIWSLKIVSSLCKRGLFTSTQMFTEVRKKYIFRPRSICHLLIKIFCWKVKIFGTIIPFKLQYQPLACHLCNTNVSCTLNMGPEEASNL